MDKININVIETEIEQGAPVSCVLVTGEKAVGFYECQKPTTGSHLVRNVTTENGQVAEYAWAESVTRNGERCRFCGGFTPCNTGFAQCDKNY